MRSPHSTSYLWLAFIAMFGVVSIHAAELTLKNSGKTLQEFSLEALSKKLAVQNFVVWEPHQSKDVTYRGIEFNRLLDAVYGEGWKKTEEVLFTCSDGYQPSLPVNRFLNHTSYLVFERLDANDKPEAFRLDNPMNQEKDVELGPYYLIWENRKDQEMRDEGPSGWPYQVVSIDLIRFLDRFPQMAPPPTASKDAQNGFLLFRKYCLSCHTINGEGGAKAIELNYPVSVTEYFKANLLERWLKDPASIRFNTAMPPFRGTAAQTKQILAYLKAMAGRKLTPKKN